MKPSKSPPSIIAFGPADSAGPCSAFATKGSARDYNCKCSPYGHVVIAGDGQATLGNTVMKGNVKKVRRLYNDKVIAGFAGGTADAFTLFELFET